MPNKQQMPHVLGWTGTVEKTAYLYNIGHAHAGTISYCQWQDKVEKERELGHTTNSCEVDPMVCNAN